jgi:hypothetical protein
MYAQMLATPWTRLVAAAWRFGAKVANANNKCIGKWYRTTCLSRVWFTKWSNWRPQPWGKWLARPREWNGKAKSRFNKLKAYATTLGFLRVCSGMASLRYAT